MKKIKIGQLGIGHNHGEGKMRAVRGLPDLFEVVGYSEGSEEWIKKRGNLPCYRDLPRLSEEELFSRSDAILVETDVWDLTEAGQRCINAGLPIHLDKPAGGTFKEFQRLIESARTRNLPVQMGYMYRYNHALCRLKSMAKEGKLGEIYQIDAEMSHFHNPEYRKWLANFQGGTMFIFGSHLIDLIFDLLGEPEKEHSFFKQTGYQGVFSEDNCLCVMEYEKTLARITDLSVEQGGFQLRRFAVMGSLGSVEIQPIEQVTAMTLYDKDGIHPIDVPDSGGATRYDDMMRDFYRSVTEGNQGAFSYDYELALQRTLYRAIGKPVYGKDKEEDKE